MATFTVTDTILNSEAAAGYFARADKRAMMGLRATCEILGIPVPEYAQRRKPGRTPAGDVLRAYEADRPAPRRMMLPARKPNHATAMAAPHDRMPSNPSAPHENLFGQAFAG